MLKNKEKELADLLDGNYQVYHRLINCSKELEEQLVKERRQTAKLQLDLKDLMAEID